MKDELFIDLEKSVKEGGRILKDSRAFVSIKRGLNEAIVFSKGKKIKVKKFTSMQLNGKKVKKDI